MPGSPRCNNLLFTDRVIDGTLKAYSLGAGSKP